MFYISSKIGFYNQGLISKTAPPFYHHYIDIIIYIYIF